MHFGKANMEDTHIQNNHRAIHGWWYAVVFMKSMILDNVAVSKPYCEV